MNEEEAVKIFDLAVRQGGLPATLDKLVPLSFIGAAAVKFYQAKVKLMNQLGITEAQRKATLEDGQDAGEMLLNIEARIGELLPAVEEARKIGTSQGRAIADGKLERSTARPEGITDKRAHYARTIHRNPAAVAEVIREAEENEDIPTKTAVLNKIRAQKAEEACQEARKSVNKKPTLSEYLTRCIEMQHEINICLAQIADNPDQVDGFELMKLAKLVRRAAELLIKTNDKEKQIWQKLLTD